MNDDIHLLAGAYALDALEPAERRRFEAHYPDCETCRADVDDHRATAAELADSIATPPPPELRARVLAQVGETRQLSPKVTPLRPGRTRAVMAAAAAVILVAFAAGALAFGLSADGERDDAVELAAVLAAPDAITTVLDPADATVAPATIRVVFSPQLARSVIVADGVASPGEGLTYELWSLDDGTPRPAGLFSPDGDGAVVNLFTADVGTPDGWGITIEPAGGSPAPTGDILYLAEV